MHTIEKNSSALNNSIAVVVPELLPVPAVKGGAVEHWVEEACNRMKIPGRRLAMVSRPANTTGTEGIQYIGIPWTRAESWFYKLKEKVTWKNPLRYIAKMQNVASYAIRVAREVRDFDLIYIHNEPNIILFLNKKAGQKIVLHMHNDHLSARAFRPLYRRAIARADKIICVSDCIRQRAISCFPEYTDKFVVVMNSTDPDSFRPYGEIAVKQLNGIISFDPTCQYILYVGRLTEVKGVHVLIEAFRQINARIPSTRLIIAGSSFFSGAAKTAYEQKLVKLAGKVSESIVFTGFLPHDKLRYLYSAADIVVCPSVWEEPFGLVIIEAMSSGTSVVASRVGGIPEVITNGEDGVLVTPNSPDELTNAVCNLLDHPAQKTAMELCGRKKILEAFTWERLVREIESEFKTLL